MNNKNRLFRVTSLLLVLCFISTAMISGTFAKYTSEYAGQDTALVARWSFTGTFDEANMSGTNIDLPIWDHAYVNNIYEIDATSGNYLIAPGIQGSFKVEFAYDADVDADLIFDFTKDGSASTTVPIQYSIDNFTTIYYDLDDLADAIIETATTTSTSTITGSAGTYVVTDTASGGPISINQTVSWKWPYDVSAHNALTAAAAGVAADRSALFAGTGALIQFAGSDTAYKEWTDADDTAIGITSKATNRDDYILTLTIAATQKVPVTASAQTLTQVAITGTAKVGEILTAGLTPNAEVATYRWQRSADGINYSNIVGATSKTYTLLAADKDKYIRVVATGVGNNKVTSDATAKVTE